MVALMCPVTEVATWSGVQEPADCISQAKATIYATQVPSLTKNHWVGEFVLFMKRGILKARQPSNLCSPDRFHFF